MNENDLRVIKTKESIDQAFMSLLKKKPLAKISVTELAKEARINKGTFYLHYEDINDLYNKTVKKVMYSAFDEADYFSDFFDNPERFCDEIGKSFKSSIPMLGVLSQDTGKHFLMSQTLEILREKIYETGRISRCPVNDMRIDAVFSAMLFCKPVYEKTCSKEIDQMMVSMIRWFHSKQMSV